MVSSKCKACKNNGRKVARKRESKIVGLRNKRLKLRVISVLCEANGTHYYRRLCTIVIACVYRRLNVQLQLSLCRWRRPEVRSE